MDGPVTEQVRVSKPPEPLYLREYLTYKTVLAGSDIWMALEAVASTMLAHPEWDADEMRTWKEWEKWETDD